MVQHSDIDHTGLPGVGSPAFSAPGTWWGAIPSNAQNTTGTINMAYYRRTFIPFTWTPNRIGVFIKTSSGNLDLGIYADDGTGLNPGARIASTGTTASPGTGRRIFTISPGSMAAGVYWLAVGVSNATLSLGYEGEGVVTSGAGPLLGLSQATAFPLPATAGAGLSALTYAPGLWLEIV